VNFKRGRWIHRTNNMDVGFVVGHLLEQLGFEQRALASAAQITESYISQLLTRKKAPVACSNRYLLQDGKIFEASKS